MSSTPRNSKGSLLAKLNKPAKAGRRKLPPAKHGKHLTTPAMRGHPDIIRNIHESKVADMREWEQCIRSYRHYFGQYAHIADVAKWVNDGRQPPRKRRNVAQSVGLGH